MNKIAIIGANGQLGTDIFNTLKSDYEAIPLLHKDIEISEKTSVYTCLDEYQPHIVINTAAIIDLNKCELEPEKAFSVNSLGPRNLSFWCKENKSLLIQISTDYVFDGKKGSPYVENDCRNALNVYGISKLAGEYFVESILEQYIIIRTSGLYGLKPCRGKSSGNFVEMFLNLIKNKYKLDFNGHEICSPTFTEHVAKQMKILIDRVEIGVFHITNEGFCSWFEFAEEILKLTKSKTKLYKRSKQKSPSKINRPEYSVLENKRLTELKIKIMPHWKEALGEYLNKRSN